MTTILADIIIIASRLSGVSVMQIKGERRDRPTVRVRWAIAVVAYEQGIHSLAGIGRALNKDHSTIMHAIKSAPGYIVRTPSYAVFIDRLKQEVEAADPYLNQWREQFVIDLPVPEQPNPIALKPLRPMFDDSEGEPDDGGHLFHNAIGEGSNALIAALRAQ